MRREKSEAVKIIIKKDVEERRGKANYKLLETMESDTKIDGVCEDDVGYQVDV